MADVTYKQLSEIKGLPSLDDLRTWRRLLEQEMGVSLFELVGVREAHGELVGIFQCKNPDEPPESGRSRAR